MEPVEVKDRILENISLSVKKVGAGTRWGLRMPTVGAERTRPGHTSGPGLRGWGQPWDSSGLRRVGRCCAVVAVLWTALGTPSPWAGGDSSGTPFCPVVEMGLWAWGQLQDSPGGCPLPRGASGGCVCRGAGLGTLLGTLQTHTTAMAVWLKDGSLDLLAEAWGWGTTLQAPTPRKRPRDTDELWDRSVGSRAPSISFARSRHFWGCPWRLPVLRA